MAMWRSLGGGHGQESDEAPWIDRSWMAPRLMSFASGVGALVPTGFEAYARVLHPARGEDGSPVRWAAIAAWSGATMHGLAQFESIARPCVAAAAALRPRPFVAAPETGNLELESLAAVCDVLGRHTANRNHCTLGVWEGYGATSPPSTTLELPERRHLLFTGPLSAAGGLGWLYGGSFGPRSPSIMWPDDRIWFLATDVDLDSTYVGGTAALIAELLADERLEVWPAAAEDDITAYSDRINPPG
jgi:hypothetical protein